MQIKYFLIFGCQNYTYYILNWEIINFMKILLKKFKYKVAAFYNFISIIDQKILLIKEELTNLATNQGIKGTILLASEGVNGTVCGTENAIVQFIEKLVKLFLVA